MADGMTDFIGKRKPAWDKLNGIVNRAGVRNASLRGLSRDDLQSLGPLYRRAAADLAYARLRGADAALIQFLNDLVTRSHGLLYIQQGPGAHRLGRFLATGFPSLLRARRIYVLLAASVFFGGALFAGVMVGVRPANLRLVVPGEFADNDKYYAERAKNAAYNSPDDEKPMFAAGLMANNIGVAVRAFAAGIMGGLPTLFLLFDNGMPVGGLAMQQHQHGRDLLFWSLILPHGIFEITAILIAGAAGMMIGYAFIAPGELPRVEAIKRAGADAIRLLFGTVPLFILAGFTESFVTPSALPSIFKLGYAALTGIALVAYFRLGATVAHRPSVVE